MKKFITRYEVVYYDKTGKNIDLIYQEFNDITKALNFMKLLHTRDVHETVLRSYIDILEEEEIL